MDNFTRFWEAYPRKVSKGQAQKAWEKLNPDDDLTTKIVLALSAQKKWRGAAHNANEFVPPWKHPATWLNSQCWLDEIGSHSELKEKQHETITFCKCGKKATQQESLCARCYTDKYSSQGATGTDVLRERLRQERRMLPKLPGESERDYFIRSKGRPEAYGVGSDQERGQDAGEITYGPEDAWATGPEG